MTVRSVRARPPPRRRSDHPRQVRPHAFRNAYLAGVEELELPDVPQTGPTLRKLAAAALAHAASLATR